MGFLLVMVLPLQGQDLSQYGWKKGVKINGGLNFNTVHYSSQGAPNRREPFNWFASGNLNINLFGYSLPFSFSLSNAAKSYTQPFNRIQFRPSYKWIKAYWGSTSMSFSPLTLSGHLFNGYGIELARGKWNFAAMYGKLKEAVAYDPILKNTSTVSFKRKGMGLKAGYRFKNGDELNIIWFTAKDDTASLVAVPQEALLTPKHNHVASVGIKKKLYKRFNIQFEYALSGIVTDQTAAGNKKTTQNRSFLKFLLPKKANVSFYDAIKASVGYNARNYGLQLQYERITPEYQTLGGYFFNSDMVNYSIAPTANLFKGKLNIGGNIGVQFNNLDKSKNSTTKRVVTNAQVSYTPGEKWNFTGGYNNFTTFTNIKPLADPFFQNPLDSLNFYQVNNSLTTSVTHSFGSKEVKKNLSVNATYQKAADVQEGTQAGTRLSSFITGNLAYNQTYAKRGLTISSSVNYSMNNAPGSRTVFFGPGVNLSAPLFKKLIRSTCGFTYNRSMQNGQNSSAVINGRAGFTYSPKTKKPEAKNNSVKTESANKTETVKTGIGKVVQAQKPWKGKQNMGLNINYMNRLPTVKTPVRFSEFTVTFNWSYSF